MVLLCSFLLKLAPHCEAYGSQMCSICGCQRLIACCVSEFKSLQNHRLTLHRNDNQIGVVGILAGVGDWGNCNSFFSLFLRQLEVLDLACVVQLADFFQPVAGRQGERKLLQPLRAGLYISTQKFRRWFGIIQIFTGYERFGTEERCSSKGELRRCGEAAFEDPYFDILSEGLPAILPRGAGTRRKIASFAAAACLCLFPMERKQVVYCRICKEASHSCFKTGRQNFLASGKNQM